MTINSNTNQVFRDLKAKICDIIDGENFSISRDELKDKIYHAYDYGEISSVQYHHLMEMLN